MSFIAKLLIDGYEINVLECHFSFKQPIDHTSRPTSKPVFQGVTMKVEAQKDVDFIDYTVQNYMPKQLELHYISREFGGKTRKVKLIDSHFVNCDTNFTSTGSAPLTETLHIKSAGFIDESSGAEYSASWRTTYPTNAPVIVRDEEKEDEEREELKFIATLERPENYKGEFGFDWMRDEYKPMEQGGQGICSNYDELKQEYNPITIEGEEYFVPWLSMFPNQENVSLTLKTTISQGRPTNKDIIKLPSKNGISFEPNEIKVKDVRGGVAVSVLCESPLSQNTSIELLDKNDAIVGKITLMKNDETYDLDIKFVKVNISNPRSLQYLKEKFERNIEKIEQHLQYNSLNQAFIKPNIIEKNFDAIEFINLDDFPDEMFGPNRRTINNKGRSEIKEKCKSVNNFKGLVVFYIGMENTKSKAGDTQTLPLNEQFVFLYLNSVLEQDVSHEIGHALGLKHLFIESSNYISKLEKNKKYYEDELRKNEKLKGNPKYEQGQIIKNITKLNERIKSINQKTIDFNQVLVNNKYKFTQSQTTNLMDYANNGKDFYHWQWLIMQKEVEKYYN